MDDLENLKQLIRQLIRGIWINRWIALLIAFPIMLGGLIFVDQIKDRYSAETKVYIDTTSVLKPLLQGLAIQTDFEANVRLMVRQLLSRPNLERAARLLDMDIEVENEQDMEKLIKRIRKRVDITAQRGGTYVISFSDPDRAQAKKMVQTLLDIFVEDTLGKSVSESDSAITFLDNQIEKYDALLQQAEQRREEFKRKNVGLMPKDGANYYGQLTEVNNQLENANRSIAEAVNRRNKLKSQLDNLVFSSDEDETSSTYDKRIKEQEVKLDDLLLSYTEEHPDVINTQLILDSLKKRRDNELREMREQGKFTVSENPVQQKLQILLTETEADISSLRARVSSYRKKQDELKKLVDIVPKIEAEMLRLNRDYEVHKDNYNQLVQRREKAKISEDVESGTEQVKFRIIEPPFVPYKPDFPKRVLFDAAVVIISLGIGYAIGLLFALLKPVFYNIDDLRQFTDHGILGAISKFDTVDALSLRRNNLFMFSLANVIMISFAGAIMAAHSQGVILSEIVKSLVSAS